MGYPSVKVDIAFEDVTALSIDNISIPVAEIAAELRAQHNIRTPDALQLATAMDSGCEAFLTNDRSLKRVKDIDVLLLDELDMV